ncbi:MAG: Cof-type HAD-IIB family hydrolase [Phycisphaerae bacterium]
MNIHLVAIDLDGTLLNSGKEITETTSKILRTAREQKNVRIVLATARPPRSVRPFYELLDLDTPMINYNGALVYDPTCSRVVLHRPMACKTVRAIVDLARSVQPKVLVSAEVMDKWYTDYYDPAYDTETGLLYKPDVVGPVEQWLNQPITKLLLLGKPERLSEVEKHIQKRFLHQVSVVHTEGHLMQIMHITAGKAQALRTVAGELNIPREQVMAIGDNANDVGMLQWAGVGVAMANAAEPVLRVADYVTDHHDADGAAHAIRRIILQGLPTRNGR